MDKIQAILKTHFGYDTFRPLQRNIIETILGGKSCLVLMPTGGGKSICYQVPALASEGTALVISPLIALMKDQVESLRANEIAAAFLNSSLSREEELSVEKDCREGKIKLLYLSPEKLIQVSTGLLSQMNISLIAIDEAHCISQWGHDFRPEYTRLEILHSLFPSVPIVALTATADKTTRKDILKQLRIENAETFIDSFDRPNIRLTVRKDLKKKEKLKEIVNFILHRKSESGIIYCLARKTTEQVADYLNAVGIPCAYYHAGMNSEQRNNVQEAFIRDDVKVITATIAFGMGIDKSNIRWIIHYNLPSKMEGYYQEIGRAGRDGLPSEALLYYNYSDLAMLMRFADESGQPHLNRQKLIMMQQFAQAPFCRRRILLNYFGESCDRNCNNCDACTSPVSLLDGSAEARKVLNLIISSNEQVSLPVLILLLRGSRSTIINETGFHNLAGFGSGMEHSYDLWQSFIGQFIQLGLIEIAFDDKFNLKVTRRGLKIIQSQEPVMVAPGIPGKATSAEPLTGTEEESPASQLFDLLRNLRKLLAGLEHVPPYIIFSDATLYEMAERCPGTREAMLTIQGVSEAKMHKYGDAFLEIIIRETEPGQRDQGISAEGHLQAGTIKSYVELMERHRMTVTAASLAKVLLGYEKTGMHPAAPSLPFFGVLRKKIRYTALVEKIRNVFENLKPVRYAHPADHYFNENVFNHIPEQQRVQLKKSIETLPMNRPDDTITNEYILNERKNFSRSYEHWVEPEVTIFRKAVEMTNDLGFLASAFRRSPDSIKSYYKRVFMNASGNSVSSDIV